MKTRTLFLFAMMLLFSMALSAQKSEELLNFEIDPNPMGDVCKIFLEFSGETAITLQIESIEGKVVKTIYSGSIYKTATFKWERDDAQGNWVPTGRYNVVVNYQSRYTSTKKTLILK